MAVLNWTDAEVFQLLSCWAEEGVQEQLEGCKRNKHVYENLSKSITSRKLANNVVTRSKSFVRTTRRLKTSISWQGVEELSGSSLMMSDRLRNSDKMFLELEGKRLKFEEQQKRKEREFQLRMVQMLQGGMGGSSMYPPQYHSSAPPPHALSSMYYSPPGSANEYWTTCTLFLIIICKKNYVDIMNWYAKLIIITTSLQTVTIVISYLM